MVSKEPLILTKNGNELKSLFTYADQNRNPFIKSED